MQETTFIYTLDCPMTGEVKYVGKSNAPKSRYRNHLNDLRENNLKTNWVKNLKSKNKTPVLSIIDEVDIGEWRFWEKYWICQMKCWGFNLKNGTNGGDGTDTLTEDAKRKMSETSPRKGKTYEEFFGKEKSEKLKKKMSDWNYERIKNGFKNNFSNESIEKMKNGIKNHWKNNKYPVENLKESIEKNSIPLLQYDMQGNLIKEWISAAEVKKVLGFDNSNISRAAKNGNKCVCGYIWKYKNI